MAFKNFSIWRARLPHWRADDVTYYVTFRHRRALTETERQWLFVSLLKPEGKKWHLEILCVLPETTHLMFKVLDSGKGRQFELSDIVEAAKRRVGKKIAAKDDRGFSPFYQESFDRIIRDEAEFEEYWLNLLDMPVAETLAEEPEDYPQLYVRGEA